jgi:protein phosphatase
MDFKHFSISDVGQVRQANEDSCGDRMTANGYVFVVCDGMGGHVGGATASSIAVDSILNFFENPVQNIYVGINDAFQLANTNILNATQQDPTLKGMGTTGTILVINEEACFIGHVGDSRIYLKSDGRLNRLTKDHSFVQTLVDQGIISDDDAEEHPKKNQILEALGIKAQVNPTICDAPIQPKAGDCFLLCSDGLNGMIKDSVIEELIDPDSPERSGRDLIDAANRAGGKDNITATLVTITESPFATSVFTHFNPVKTAVASETVIEPMIGQEPKKSKKKLTIILSSIGFLVIIAVLWFTVFNSNQGKPTDPSPSDKDPVTQEDEKDTNEDESNSDEKNNNKEVEQK